MDPSHSYPNGSVPWNATSSEPIRTDLRTADRAVGLNERPITNRFAKVLSKCMGFIQLCFVSDELKQWSMAVIDERVSRVEP